MRHRAALQHHVGRVRNSCAFSFSWKFSTAKAATLAMWVSWSLSPSAPFLSRRRRSRVGLGTTRSMKRRTSSGQSSPANLSRAGTGNPASTEQASERRFAEPRPSTDAEGSSGNALNFLILLGKLVPEVRIELTTYPLPRGCATTTLLRHPRRDRPKDGVYILLCGLRERVVAWRIRRNLRKAWSGLPQPSGKTSSDGRLRPGPRANVRPRQPRPRPRNRCLSPPGTTNRPLSQNRLPR